MSRWVFVQAGVDRIMGDLREGMDMKTYVELYTAIHNYCANQKAVSGGPGTASHRGGAHLNGEEVYYRLITYLHNHLQDIRHKSEEHSNEALLNFFIKEWDRYTSAGQYVNHLFRYLNRHWVRREVEEGKKNIYDIYTLHLVRWKEDYFEHAQGNVMSAVLRLVQKQRNGETIEQSQIKRIVDSFVALGLDESDNTKSTLDVYRKSFELPFLAATKEYYENESRRFLAEHTVVEYMKKAETLLDEEKERVSLYLLGEILIPLLKCCESALIADHSMLLRDEFQFLLDSDKRDDLARMYRLLARIPNGLEPLRNRFESHVRKAGLASVEKVAEAGDNLEPKVYVDSLLSVHGRYHDLVAAAFNAETEFVRSLDNACREFVNRNKVCKSGSTRSPELLAKYTDTLLKKSTVKTNNEEDKMESRLVEIMTVFKYIEDKDVFQKFYSRMLAKRLVQLTSCSDDAETSMIGKLKEACGFEYTNKLQRMFQDMQISKDLNTAFKDWQATSPSPEGTPVDASYHILGTGFWPLTPPTTPFSPPEIIVKTYTRFATFYLTKHQGRKLSWLWQLCKGEVRANYIKAPGTKVPYTFQVSTYQLAILLLFNNSDNISYEEIAEATKLAAETLDPSISVFVKAKVLTASREDSKPERGVRYSLNHAFKSKKLKINLNIGIKSEQKQEVEDTHKTIEEDRKLLMQSAIVRIMKSRKTMKHVQLVQETISQIKSRFSPKIGDIKKCIDILLEKEYLERLENDDLGYLA